MDHREFIRAISTRTKVMVGVFLYKIVARFYYFSNVSDLKASKGVMR
jgi:hypothetical protein